MAVQRSLCGQCTYEVGTDNEGLRRELQKPAATTRTRACHVRCVREGGGSLVSVHLMVASLPASLFAISSTMSQCWLQGILLY
jgi:hypothetical protein